jgi:hypothetical protein
MLIPERMVEVWVSHATIMMWPGCSIWAGTPVTQAKQADADFRVDTQGKLLYLELKGLKAFTARGAPVVPWGKKNAAQLDGYCMGPYANRVFYVLPGLRASRLTNPTATSSEEVLRNELMGPQIRLAATQEWLYVVRALDLKGWPGLRKAPQGIDPLELHSDPSINVMPLASFLDEVDRCHLVTLADRGTYPTRPGNPTDSRAREDAIRNVLAVWVPAHTLWEARRIDSIYSRRVQDFLF